VYYIILITISAIAPTDKSVTTAVNQIISCDISGLEAAATVEWLGPGNDTPISESDTTNYVVDQGAGAFSGGSQKTTLTILPAKLAVIASSSPATYKCSVKSGHYAASLASKADVVVTVLAFGKLLKLEQFMSNCL